MKQEKSIKILLVTGIFPPEIGGPATYSQLLKDHLPGFGFAVEVLSFGSVRHWPKGLRHWLFFRQVMNKAKGADFIFAQDTVSVGLPAALAAKILSKPLVLRVPGDYAWEQSVQRFKVGDNIDQFQNKRYGFKTEFLRRCQSWVANRACLVIAPSLYFKNLVSGWVKNPKKVMVIYNGIDWPKEKIKVKNYSSREKLIISAGRLVPWKGYAVLIKMLAQLPDWRLEIFGSGPDELYLSQLIADLNLGSRVVLMGAVAKEKLYQRAGQSRLFILNTSFESFSYQIVEMMSLGVPVIATNIGNLAEIITDQVSGILVEPDNLPQLLSAVTKIDSDELFRERLVAAAAARARDFTIDKTLSSLAGVLKDCL